MFVNLIDLLHVHMEQYGQKKNIVFPITRPTHHFRADLLRFLAPPAKWQRSFSNADSAVVRRRRRLSSTFHLNG